MPDFRIVGTSLEELDDDGFRAFAKQACQEFARHPVSPEELDSFAARLSYLGPDAGADGLAAAVARPSASSAASLAASTT